MPYYPQQYLYPYQQIPQYPIPQQPQQPMQPQAQQPQQNNGGIIWVPSEQDAANYLVMPNTAVALWNANAPVVYLKQADASGKPSMRVYDLVERTQNAPAQSTTQAVQFASVDDLKALAARVGEIEHRFEAPAKEGKK